MIVLLKGGGGGGGWCKMRSNRFGSSATPYLGATFGGKGGRRNAVMVVERKHERTKFRAQHLFTPNFF